MFICFWMFFSTEPYSSHEALSANVRPLVISCSSTLVCFERLSMTEECSQPAPPVGVESKDNKRDKTDINLPATYCTSMCSQILNGFYLRILKIRKWGAQTIYPSYGHKQTTLRVKKITGNLISRMTLVFYKQHAIWLHSSVVEVSVSKSWWFESRSCEHKFQCFEVLSFSWHMTGFILYILTDVKSAKFNSNECFLATGRPYFSNTKKVCIAAYRH